jgi:hypothetical protein
MSDHSAAPLFDTTAATGAAPTASQTLPAPAGWPRPPDPAAHHGLAGDIIAAIAPHTEADPVAILGQLLVAFGAATGRGAWFTVEASRHHANEFLILVGESAKARKGSSWDHVARVIAQADPTITARILTGLSSGEGLIWAVRDSAGSDPGPPDRRLLVIEPEFASVLKQTTRDINTLSPVLRCAWDGRPMAIMTRSAPARASAAHISVIGHITHVELRHQTNTVELANGFLNRFLFLACRRVRLLPEGGDPDPLAATGLPERLARNLARARTAGELGLDPDARQQWHHAYHQLSTTAPGITGTVTARAEAHVIRLALLYALINGATAITPPHLAAALALADYASTSATWALAHSTTDPLAADILSALAHTPAGLTRTQIRDLFNRNQPAARIDAALAALAHDGTITSTRILTGGRPADLWNTAAPKS